jgi:2-haloacid dehalogenase
MSFTLDDFDVITFDVYGTLIDWEPSIIAFLGNWARRHGITEDGHTLLMGFDQARAVIQQERPALLYPDVLRRCFRQICAEHDVSPDPETCEQFAGTPHDWPAYPDTHDGLARLQKQARIGALSNIDNASLAASCRHMQIRFDITVTAERVGAYKPDMPHFEAALADIDALGIPRERILHVGQSLRADITPANRLGLTSVWIHRPDRHLGLTGFGAEEARPDLTVSTLAELVSVLTDH